MATDRSKTTMVIRELVVPEGTDDLVINVEAKRGGRTFKLPYHIKADNVGKIERDWLMARVLDDVDLLVEQENKRAAIKAKLEGLVGHEIKLD